LYFAIETEQNNSGTILKHVISHGKQG